jgi:uncharacterized NAD(P)/FAD-binding protein YdhS
VNGAPHLVIVGAGPRAAMLLERVLARLDERAELRIDLVDPHPAGAGRIWRHAQSPLLKLNSMARDVTMFTDDSCAIEGPVRPGPSLAEWVAAWRNGHLADVQLDELSAAEARSLEGDGFPTRRLQSHYLDWFFRRAVEAAPPGVTVTVHADTVTGVAASVDGRRTVSLAGGRDLLADGVVYALGHNEREPDAELAAFIDAARRHGLHYVPPAFTADADLSSLPEQDDVIVRGMGLAAIDLVVLLTQGRGGRFDRAADGRLRYHASGREPRLHLSSRRGVPYRSKVTSALIGAAPQREVVTPAAIAALVARRTPVDFERDVWPLVAGELLFGHYRELFTGHPDRVHGTWEEFRVVLSAHAWNDPALLEAIALAVPDPEDRFDVASFDQPFAAARFVDDDDAHAQVAAHIARDLTLRTTPEHSAAQGVFMSALLSYFAISEIPAERWSARSRVHSLPVRWHTFFSYLASGPPPHRLEELLALADAGVVRFLGPDVSVRIEADTYVASSPAVGVETRARFLVDAWLPRSDARASTTRALRELATVHGTEVTFADADFEGSLGRVLVDDDGRIVRADGTPHVDLFAIGPFTSQTEGGAFTRPGIDSLAFRQTDRVAAAVEAHLAAAVPVA